MPFECDFAGTLTDVEVLDYLDYEGLPYPPSDIDGTALVWGNVVAKQLGMSWFTTLAGELLLHHYAPGNRITIWPLARVLEIQERSMPQFGKYEWILIRTIRECMSYGDLAKESIAWCRTVLKDNEQVGIL